MRKGSGGEGREGVSEYDGVISRTKHRQESISKDHLAAPISAVPPCCPAMARNNVTHAQRTVRTGLRR